VRYIRIIRNVVVDNSTLPRTTTSTVHARTHVGTDYRTTDRTPAARARRHRHRGRRRRDAPTPTRAVRGPSRVDLSSSVLTMPMSRANLSFSRRRGSAAAHAPGSVPTPRHGYVHLHGSAYRSITCAVSCTSILPRRLGASAGTSWSGRRRQARTDCRGAGTVRALMSKARRSTGHRCVHFKTPAAVACLADTRSAFGPAAMVCIDGSLPSARESSHTGATSHVRSALLCATHSSPCS
jgi:hypothetical protein